MSSETLMEKPTSGKCRCRTQSWYTVFISFLLWFTLYVIYLYSSSVTFSKREYSLTVNNDTAILDSSESFRGALRDHETEDFSRVGGINLEDIVDDEDETDSETEEKPVEELSEDDEVYQAIQSLLTEEQNETEPVETETNSGNENEDVAGSKGVKNMDEDDRTAKDKRKENHATEQKKGTANVAKRKREDNAEDREKGKEDRVAKREGAANHLERHMGENVEDRAAKGKAAANVLEQHMEDNAEDREKRNEARLKETANVSERQKGENVEHRAAKGKGTANVLEQHMEDNAEDREKRNGAGRKETANDSEQQKGENVEHRVAKGNGTANVLKLHMEDNAEGQEKRNEAKRKEAANVETLPVIKNRNERTGHPRRETRNKPGDSSDHVMEKRNEKAVVLLRRPRARSDPCSGRYIYIHNLPRKFNQDLLETCRSLSFWTDMCECASNLGLGAPLPRDDKLYSGTGWFNTNQFLLEVIFHNKMKQYRCLTKDPSVASAIYVPYYAGLDVGRYLWDPDGFMRDYDAVNLVKWLASRPEWKRMWGRDHFLVAGRINWDFRRDPRNESDWGNELLNFDESRNMTSLVLESCPWNYNDFAIPYPTYFHPSRDSEVFQWQDRMRRLKRRFLFSFAGARRPGRHESIRNELIDQCLATRKRCRFLECDKTQKCHKPAYLLKLFQSSIFCLQPSGDSYTRRSIFDSIVAGCIPVFFHPGSAYVQYIWHFPKDYRKYSVFIPERDVKSGKANIERILQRVSREKRAAMRDEVINMIPSVIYANPSSRLRKTEDAFDLTVKGVLDRIETVRNQMNEGKIVNYEFDEEESWKYFAFGKLGPHEWDIYFSRKSGQHGP
ncbi:Xyloglucan galactosyltransferase KATAMARI1-like protein [Hibiscus syriacus]|uniref:Xyloglucan galactosyltransferase KATAMARI1-like protein n=1 Tax=Hibiscus syriacus TaxID=106335 RepID=A0A6A2WF21_HIBSY|nr:xyloglucan galactosyltransferase KATAMARI1 homolog [Hibiscus syriacus]KAE8656808.1 Xyloglucan galactosyltransferase KATAMARI1-like protein [Hibiscus syriacus]